METGVSALGKVGRHRKANAKRKSGGRLANPTKAERLDAIKGPVLAQRYKFEALSKLDEEYREGALGRALVLDIIDAQQKTAGEAYNALVRRYAGLKGIPLGPPRGQQFERAYGIVLRPDVRPSTMEKIEAEYDEAVGALKDAGMPAIREVNAVAVYGQDVSAPHDLRVGLSTLVKHWRIADDDDDPPIAHRLRKWMAGDARPKIDAEG